MAALRELGALLYLFTTETCEISQLPRQTRKLRIPPKCTDFLAALSVETPWKFTLFPRIQRKFTV